MVRILVVEDNRDGAESLRLLLTLLGHDVRVAHSGTDGVRIGREWRPGIVLCDIGLPELDGFEVAGKLRHDEATAHVRLIAITAYAEEEVRRRAQESGFDAFLTKPTDLRMVAQLIAAAGAPSS
jgi:CheY-like chemotaxis protein